MKTPHLILVVEDTPAIARLVASLLSRAGFQVAVAGTGAEAIAAVATARPSLVLTDWQLPGGLTGIGIARILKSDPQTQTIPIVAMTGSTTDVAVLEDAGFAAHVLKPFTAETLLRVVNACLAAMPEPPRHD